MQTPIRFYGGRFGNRLFGNLALHFLSQKYQIPIEYTYERECNELGIKFHKCTGRILTNPIPLAITDSTFMDFINYDISGEPVFRIEDAYFQTREFALYLVNYFAKPDIRQAIRNANPFRDRYTTNRSVFVHVRLGDKTGQNISSKEYFTKALNSISFKDGYIASDTPNHPLVQELIKEYNLILFQDTEVRTIQLASTCRYQVLSQGTFSFIMGLLGFDTDLVQWPQIKQPWHGDIFVIPEWKEVNW
jgi:hypothetical protein